jgi:hypothetical protein
MHIRVSKTVIAAAAAVTLGFVASPAAAHAVAADRTPVSLSVIMSKSMSLAATPVGIKNQKSAKFLQPSGGGTANNTHIVQEPASSSSTQGWLLFSDGTFTTHQNFGVDRNMGTSGAGTAAGTPAVIVNGSSSFDQDWLVDPKSDGVHFRLKNRKDQSKCLGISGASTANGAAADIFACDTTTNQTWSYTTF